MALLAVSAGALLALAESASASCGDYVIFRPLDGGAPQADRQLWATLFPPVLPGHVPCRGPLCRGGQPLDPLPVPPSPEQFEQRPLALVAAAVEIECPYRAGGGWPRQNESPLAGFALVLLRPPCA